MKIAAVTASTNNVSPKMDLAGVDAGAKMFVGLKGGLGSAKAIPLPQIQKASCDMRTRQLRGPWNRNLIPQFDWSPSGPVPRGPGIQCGDHRSGGRRSRNLPGEHDLPCGQLLSVDFFIGAIIGTDG